jgi:hypothetical protein
MNDRSVGRWHSPSGARPPKRGVVHGSGLGHWRWMVERTLAWLHQYRRLRIRWERRADIHEGLPQAGRVSNLLAAFEGTTYRPVVQRGA